MIHACSGRLVGGRDDDWARSCANRRRRSAAPAETNTEAPEVEMNGGKSRARHAAKRWEACFPLGPFPLPTPPWGGGHSPAAGEGDAAHVTPSYRKIDLIFGREKCGNGAPGEIRTPDLQLRRLPLYPAELRARTSSLHRDTTWALASGSQFESKKIDKLQA